MMVEWSSWEQIQLSTELACSINYRHFCCIFFPIIINRDTLILLPKFLIVIFEKRKKIVELQGIRKVPRVEQQSSNTETGRNLHEKGFMTCCNIFCYNEGFGVSRVWEV